jgi:hypothetical protein
MRNQCLHTPPSSVWGAIDAKERDVILLSPEDWVVEITMKLLYSRNFDILSGMS